MAPHGWRRHVLGPPAVRSAPWWLRLRESRRVYRARHGDHLAAAVTFFTMVAVVPLLMLAVSLSGFVLSSSQAVLAQAEGFVAMELPPPASTQMVDLLHVVVAERGTLGVLGLVAAAVSGWSWISHLRDAVTALLGQAAPEGRWRHALRDVGTLLGVGFALAVSFALAALAGAAWNRLIELLGPTSALLVAGSVVIGFVANWLVVAWCLARLPRRVRPLRPQLPAAAVAAVGLVVIQQLGGLYVRLLGGSPAVATLGALLGLLLVVNLVVRWLLMVTVWADTAVPESVPERGEAVRPGIEFLADLVG